MLSGARFRRERIGYLTLTGGALAHLRRTAARRDVKLKNELTSPVPPASLSLELSERTKNTGGHVGKIHRLSFTAPAVGCG
jgi:hypothetical protein